MEKQALLYEGKAKRLYRTNEPETLFVEYLDQVTALNGKRKEVMNNKGALNNQITSFIFQQLADAGIASHFIEELSPTTQLIKAVTIFPLEIVVRNQAAGSFAKRFGLTTEEPFTTPILEFYYKKDELDDPFINDDHVYYLNIATKEEVATLRELAFKVNAALQEIFLACDITLVDFKIECGKTTEGQILLADEISPDTCRLQDRQSGNSLDKDLYRKKTGDILPVYQEVLSRLQKTFKGA